MTLLRICLFSAALFPPLARSNTVMQMKKKLQQYTKTKIYFEKLSEPMQSLVGGEPFATSYVDYHLYKLALSLKFKSQVTQLVIDFCLGVLALVYIYSNPAFFFELSNSIGANLHLDNLEQRIYWIIGFPAGFKPNENLGIFFGNVLLGIISAWNYISVFLHEVKLVIVVYVSFFGSFGISHQLAAVNDVLFICSCWLLVIYSIFAFMYNFTVNMMLTLLRLFRSKKYNVMRERDDANNYSVAELYLGVLIITLSIFLLPTVAIFYYYVFISIILNVLALQLVSILLQTFVVEFPYHLLTLVAF